METGVALEQMLHAAHMYHVGRECARPMQPVCRVWEFWFAEGVPQRGVADLQVRFPWDEPIVIRWALGPRATIE